MNSSTDILATGRQKVTAANVQAMSIREILINIHRKPPRLSRRLEDAKSPTRRLRGVSLHSKIRAVRSHVNGRTCKPLENPIAEAERGVNEEGGEEDDTEPPTKRRRVRK
ncbi:uncharacterized protein FMAN_02166 [Fusarium mangiferae]|uniref:Uncharacterized protein n=1 Tax=Fusarium mangiferae TaxID=192010 RepID=A0A1L7TKW4_FUSMA|nr:uncharacterized protein FMAN_02166 [Fusarium mangiferae]CVK99318.1 uncharacterized protein FMAN_02166 [Fusarium mangiferae]